MNHYFVKALLAFSIFFLCAFANSAEFRHEEYRPGYYIDKTGKVEGYIYFGYNTHEKFSFKKTLADKRIIKYQTECDGFYVDGKTFKVINYAYLDAVKVFAEVVLEGSVNLYKVYSIKGSGGASNPHVANIEKFILQRSGTQTFVLAPWRKNKFKKVMTNVFNDNEGLIAKINDETYTFDNLTYLVDDYNFQHLPSIKK